MASHSRTSVWRKGFGTLLDKLYGKIPLVEYEQALEHLEHPYALSEILWVAFGISHDGKRTIPTAMNQQNLKVYVVRNDGAWLYDAAENSLTQVTAENLQPLFATQDFMKDVPVNLVYVGSDEKYSPMHAGSAYQNVGLYAASKGMHSVVRGYFDNDRVTKALNLENGERAIVSQAIGW